ncbi:hypothetical protein PO909_033754 [Leuciscus waleckii]
MCSLQHQGQLQKFSDVIQHGRSPSQLSPCALRVLPAQSVQATICIPAMRAATIQSPSSNGEEMIATHKVTFDTQGPSDEFNLQPLQELTMQAFQNTNQMTFDHHNMVVTQHLS